MSEPEPPLPPPQRPPSLTPPAEGDPIPSEYLLSRINQIADLPEPQLYVHHPKKRSTAPGQDRATQKPTRRPPRSPTGPSSSNTTPTSPSVSSISASSVPKGAGYTVGPPNTHAYTKGLPSTIPASVLDLFEGTPEDAERAALELFEICSKSALGTEANRSASAGPSLNAFPSSAALCVQARLGQLTSNSALADSGARKCFISHEIARWAEAHVQGARRALSEFPAAVVANSMRVPILGKLTLPVTLGNKSYSADFYVLPTCSYDFILGLDFFEKYDLSIADHARKICIGKDNCLERCECTRALHGAAGATTPVSALEMPPPALEPFDKTNRFYEIYSRRSEQLQPLGRALVHCTTKAPSNRSGIIHPLPNSKFTSCQYFFDAKLNDCNFDIEVTNLDPYMTLPLPRKTVIGFLEVLDDNDYAKFLHAEGSALPADGIELNTIDTDAIYSYGAISPEAPVTFSATALAAVDESADTPPPPVPPRTTEQVRAALEAIQISGSPELVASIKKIVGNFPDLFSLTGITRHMNNGTSAKVQVSADPEVARYSRWTEAATRNGKPMLMQHLQRGILEWAPADDARYRHAVFLKKKSNGKFRLLSDLRSVNKVLLLDRYPLPTVQQSLDALSGSQYFAAFDVVDAFYSIPLDLASRKYLTFATPWGLMRYRVLAQGLATSPAIFQRAINKTLVETAWSTVISYIDDLLLYSKTEEGFLNALTEEIGRAHV